MEQQQLKGTDALAKGVPYTDSQGRLKAAVITAVPATIHPEGTLTLAEGQVMLAVFSMTGHGFYARRAVLGEDGTFHRASEHDYDADDD